MTEWAEGGTLEQTIKKRKGDEKEFSEEQLVSYTVMVLLALE